MEILISANEKILTIMTQSSKTHLSKDMTKEEYGEWLKKMIQAEVKNEKEI